MIDRIDCKQLREWEACYYTDGNGTSDEVDALMVEWAGGESATPLEVLDLDAVSVEDRLWVALQPDVLSERYQRHLACDCAEHVLSIFEREDPDDKRPREAIEVARRYADGGATKEELATAEAAARDAARGVWAASPAAWFAIWAAKWAATWAAARAATRAAERAWQLERCRHWLRVQAKDE